MSASCRRQKFCGSPVNQNTTSERFLCAADGWTSLASIILALIGRDIFVGKYEQAVKSCNFLNGMQLNRTRSSADADNGLDAFVGQSR